jgi:hypothetical protein
MLELELELVLLTFRLLMDEFKLSRGRESPGEMEVISGLMSSTTLLLMLLLLLLLRQVGEAIWQGGGGGGGTGATSCSGRDDVTVARSPF